MDEDDTFRKLCKPTFDEMMEIYSEWSAIQDYPNPGKAAREDLFGKHGWTMKEFLLFIEVS